MAVTPHQNQSDPSISTNPTADSHPQQHHPFQDYDDEPAAFSSSFCLCFGRRRGRTPAAASGGSRSYFLPIDRDDYSENRDGTAVSWPSRSGRWVVEKLKKVREISEVAAGPRWKNFIRRVSGSLRSAVGSVNRKRSGTRVKYQYDPQSYALNFDDAVAADDESGYIDFSARFAATPPTSAGA
ncbi:hypothetical protein LINPERHAP1_LOCUS32241 [Linum perenne]